MGGAMLVVAPSSALAHDSVGGEELSITNWIFIAALVVIVMGLLAGLWALKNGQFSNVEESKYRMIDLSDDYDAVMSEVDEREHAAQASDKSKKGEK